MADLRVLADYIDSQSYIWVWAFLLTWLSVVLATMSVNSDFKHFTCGQSEWEAKHQQTKSCRKANRKLKGPKPQGRRRQA